MHFQIIYVNNSLYPLSNVLHPVEFRMAWAGTPNVAIVFQPKTHIMRPIIGHDVPIIHCGLDQKLYK